MPVSKNKRKNGKVAKRHVTTATLDSRARGIEGILKLLSRATASRVAFDNDTVMRLTLQKGL